MEKITAELNQCIVKNTKDAKKNIEELKKAQYLLNSLNAYLTIYVPQAIENVKNGYIKSVANSLDCYDFGGNKEDFILCRWPIG